MKTIIVCCATSMITSSVAIEKIQNALDKEGLKAKIIQCKFMDVEGYIDMYKPDLIVPTGALKEDKAHGVPMVRGTNFVTGVNEEQTINKIIDIIKK